MKTKIKINKKEYELKPIDFNAICELEDLGLDINDPNKKVMSSIRALLAYHGMIDPIEAGQEILAHLSAGGSLDDFSLLIEDFVNSDFFRAIQQSPETEEVGESEKKS